MTNIVSNKPLLELQRFSKLFVKEANLAIIILLAVAILAFPYFLKESNLPLGKESYDNLRIAKKILNEKGLPDNNFIGWPLLIALTGFIFRLPVEIAMNILLFLLGIVCVILFYNILRIYNSEVRSFSCLALVISPAFIYLFLEGDKYTVPIVLSLLLTYFINFFN